LNRKLSTNSGDSESDMIFIQLLYHVCDFFNCC